MKTNFFLLIAMAIALFSQCDRKPGDFEGETVSYTTKEIDCPSYMAPQGPTGIKSKSSFNFLSSGDSMLLYYYSSRADSFYLYDVTGNPHFLSSHFFNVHDTSKKEVLGITPITRDSLFILCNNSLHIYDLKRNKAVFHKSIPEKYSLLSRFNPPIYNEQENAVYMELIEWNVPEENGILDTRLIAKISLSEKDVEFLKPKSPDNRSKAGSKKYFTIWNNKLFYSFANSKKIDVLNLNTNKLTHKKPYTPVSLDGNIKSEKHNKIDSMRENTIRNTFFGELFASEQFLYRIQFLPLPARNKKGFVPKLKNKKTIMLEYNKNLNLKRVLKPESKPGLFLFEYLNWHQGQIYGLRHIPEKITIYKFKI